MELGIKLPNVNIADLVKKLDIDFYSGRWARITDKQRDLLLSLHHYPMQTMSLR